MLKEPVRRIRFLRRDEADRLIAALPEHLAAMARFSLATGLRASNVTGLQWTAVDLVRRVAWIHPDQATGRRAIPVPLSTEAVLLVRGRLGTHPTHVFSYLGKPIKQVSTKAWYAALAAAGIEDFAGMTGGTSGRAGMCNRERHCSRCRRWVAGKVWTWCAVTRILPRTISRRSRRNCASL
jgi:integrase